MRALEPDDGNIAAAAREIGGSPQHRRAIVRREPGMAEALAEIREALCDEAEGALLAALRRGEPGAIVFALKQEPEPTPIHWKGRSDHALREIANSTDDETGTVDCASMSQTTRDGLRAAIERGKVQQALSRQRRSRFKARWGPQAARGPAVRTGAGSLRRRRADGSGPCSA